VKTLRVRDAAENNARCLKNLREGAVWHAFNLNQGEGYPVLVEVIKMTHGEIGKLPDAPWYEIKKRVQDFELFPIPDDIRDQLLLVSREDPKFEIKADVRLYYTGRESINGPAPEHLRVFIFEKE